MEEKASIRLARCGFPLIGLAAAIASRSLCGAASPADRWDWSERKPAIVWRAEIGVGFSAVAVDDRMVFAFGNVADEDRVTALEAGTGAVRWQYRYPCRALGLAKPDEAGPRATPVLRAGALFTLGRDGRLLCLDAADGRLRWWKDIPAEIGEKPPYWGFSGTPLVLDEMLILSVGDHGLALRAEDGKIVWKSPPAASKVWEDEPVGVSSYASPQVAMYGGRRLVGIPNEREWVLVDREDGSRVWATRWRVPYGVTASQPVVAGQIAILSGGYGYGTRAVTLGGDQVWATKRLRSHAANVAVVGEHLYGIDGNQQDGARCELRCLRLSDGEVVWSKERFGFGNLSLVDGRILVLTMRGELVAVVPDPGGYRESGRLEVLDGDSWTAPLVSGGRIFARNKQGTLVRVDLP